MVDDEFATITIDGRKLSKHTPANPARGLSIDKRLKIFYPNNKSYSDSVITPLSFKSLANFSNLSELSG